jgi:hypothetical protein
LSTTLFKIWHLTVLTLARCNFRQNFITHGDGLVDRVDACIASQTLDMATHVLGHHRDDCSLGTGTCSTT